MVRSSEGTLPRLRGIDSIIAAEKVIPIEI